ncbi:MAG: uracil-DNA glycosylase [Leptolinea sp.]|nr:uracil-DNA glycosylase [Leptolinea sp.]
MPSIHQLNQLEGEIIACRLCPRLVTWREQVAREKRRAYRDQEYWGRPVPGFGDPQARLLIIGLAPGAHGSNRTGRMFTGDASGDFLYPALHRAGFASIPKAIQRDDGLELKNLFISAICRCAPPGNKPAREEIANCLPYLREEINLLPNLKGIVALGSIAFSETLSLLDQKQPDRVFGHGVFYELGGGLPWLLASYHPSRQNTQTGRLTTVMFDSIWQMARAKLDGA